MNEETRKYIEDLYVEFLKGAADALGVPVREVAGQHIELRPDIKYNTKLVIEVRYNPKETVGMEKASYPFYRKHYEVLLDLYHRL